MGRLLDPLLQLGAGALRGTTSQRQGPPRGLALGRPQMDPHSVSLLAGPRALFRAGPSQSSAAPPAQAGVDSHCHSVEILCRILQDFSTKLLTDQLRCLTVAVPCGLNAETEPGPY